MVVSESWKSSCEMKIGEVIDFLIVIFLAMATAMEFFSFQKSDKSGRSSGVPFLGASLPVSYGTIPGLVLYGRANPRPPQRYHDVVMRS